MFELSAVPWVTQDTMPTDAELESMYDAMNPPEARLPFATFSPGRALPPGPCAAATLDTFDPSDLDDDSLVDHIGSWERLIGWAQARQAIAMAEFGRRRPAEDGLRWDRKGFAADELAPALRCAPQTASSRLAIATEVTSRFPATMKAWRDGTIDSTKVRAIVDTICAFDDDRVLAAERALYPNAETQTAGQLRAKLARIALKLDPNTAEQRSREAYADRRVLVTPSSDGMSELWALLPAAGAQRLRATLDAHARASAGDGRSSDQLRADALVDLADIAADSLPPAAARQAQVQVTVAATTLLGLDDDPAELAGYGPITAGLARRIAGDATWRRLLTDPATGALLDYGRTTYQPPAALADQVRARDRVCRFPGCRRSARSADLDHTVRYPDGPTAAGNLAALCRRHHRLKHEGGWQLAQKPGGSLLWTTPGGGHTYRTEPDPLDDPAPF